MVRGDCGFGNEPFIAELEERAQPYLFKLRQTVGVKKLLARQFARDGWSPAPATKAGARRRHPQTLGLGQIASGGCLAPGRQNRFGAESQAKNESGEQIELLMPDKDVQAWEYAVLVTNSAYALDAFGQLYRDRADCENGFDE